MTGHGTRHVPSRWISLFTIFKAVESLGADDCLTASYIFLSEQGDETAYMYDEQPTNYSGTVGLFIFHSLLHVVNL